MTENKNNSKIIQRFRKYAEIYEKEGRTYNKSLPPDIYQNRFLFKGILWFISGLGWKINHNWREGLKNLEIMEDVD